MKKAYFVHPTSSVAKTARIGNDTRIWRFCHVEEGARIGEGCRLGQNVYVGPDVTIGNNVKIQNNVSVYAGVTLEDDVFCGPSIVFTNIFNPRSAYPRNSKDFYRKTLVKKGSSIGANSTVVCGVTLGNHSFVGAGSVVTKDVVDYALVYGNPAKPRGWMCECGEKLNFKNDEARCLLCKRKYKKSGLRIIKA